MASYDLEQFEYDKYDSRYVDQTDELHELEIFVNEEERRTINGITNEMEHRDKITWNQDNEEYKNMSPREHIKTEPSSDWFSYYIPKDFHMKGVISGGSNHHATTSDVIDFFRKLFEIFKLPYDHLISSRPPPPQNDLTHGHSRFPMFLEDLKKIAEEVVELNTLNECLEKSIYLGKDKFDEINCFVLPKYYPENLKVSYVQEREKIVKETIRKLNKVTYEYVSKDLCSFSHRFYFTHNHPSSPILTVKELEAFVSASLGTLFDPIKSLISNERNKLYKFSTKPRDNSKTNTVSSKNRSSQSICITPSVIPLMAPENLKFDPYPSPESNHPVNRRSDHRLSLSRERSFRSRQQSPVLRSLFSATEASYLRYSSVNGGHRLESHQRSPPPRERSLSRRRSRNKHY